MSTDADRALMVAVLSQVDIGKLNYAKIAQDLNLKTKSAAWKRWSRFKAKLYNGTPPAKTASVVGVTTQATPTKNGRAKNRPPAKRRKRAAKDSDDETEDEHGLDVKGKLINGDWNDAAAELPLRRLPVRKARVANFKEEVTSEEEDAEDVASGGLENGGMMTRDSEDISENRVVGDEDDA